MGCLPIVAVAVVEGACFPTAATMVACLLAAAAAAATAVVGLCRPTEAVVAVDTHLRMEEAAAKEAAAVVVTHPMEEEAAAAAAVVEDTGLQTVEEAAAAVEAVGVAEVTVQEAVATLEAPGGKSPFLPRRPRARCPSTSRSKAQRVLVAEAAVWQTRHPTRAAHPYLFRRAPFTVGSAYASVPAEVAVTAAAAVVVTTMVAT